MIKCGAPCESDGFTCPYDAINIEDCEMFCGEQTLPDDGDINFNYDTIYIDTVFPDD